MNVTWGQVKLRDSIKRSTMFKGSLSTPMLINPTSFAQKCLVKSIYQPFFCDLERKIEIKTKIPIFFRLGRKDYADQLEGK